MSPERLNMKARVSWNLGLIFHASNNSLPAVECMLMHISSPIGVQTLLEAAFHQICSTTCIFAKLFLKLNPETGREAFTPDGTAGKLFAFSGKKIMCPEWGVRETGHSSSNTLALLRSKVEASKSSPA